MWRFYYYLMEQSWCQSVSVSALTDITDVQVEEDGLFHVSLSHCSLCSQTQKIREKILYQLLLASYISVTSELLTQLIYCRFAFHFLWHYKEMACNIQDSYFWWYKSFKFLCQTFPKFPLHPNLFMLHYYIIKFHRQFLM